MYRSGMMASALALALMVAGCGEQPTSAVDEAPLLDQSAAPANGSAVAALGMDLGAIQQLTARYHKVENAIAAGFAPVTPCLESPAGGQGYHYANFAKVDGTIDPLDPEVLLYEPQAGGRLRLVGIEYIAPLALPEPAPLFGQHFHANAGAGLWALHVWNWRNNPDGLFKDWNPKVSCRHAS